MVGAVGAADPVGAERVAATDDTPLTRRLVWLAAVGGIVLRVWFALEADTIADELFESAHARQPLSWLVPWSLSEDVHGPVGYALRAPFVSDQSVLLLRVPSLIASCGGLVLMAWAMARRGWFGVAVLTFTAIDALLLVWGVQARMYSLMILAGTSVFVISERWMQRPTTRLAVGCGAILLGAVLADSTAVFLALGACCVPGFDRRREAWIWRAGPVLAVVTYLAVLAPSLAERAAVAEHVPFIPYTTPHSLGVALNGLVSVFYPQVAVVSVLVLAVGVWGLWRHDRSLGWLVVALAVLPVGAMAVIGTQVRVLIPRTLSVVAWAAPLALAGLVVLLRRRSDVIAVAGALLIVVMMIPSTVFAFSYREGAEASVAVLGDRVGPGDLAAVYPPSNVYLLTWEFDTPIRPEPVPSLADDALAAVQPRPGEPTGRVWVLENDDLPFPADGLRRCPGTAEEQLDGYTLSCFIDLWEP